MPYTTGGGGAWFPPNTKSFDRETDNQHDTCMRNPVDSHSTIMSLYNSS